VRTNLARLAEEALDRLGDRPALFYEGVWHSSGALHDRARRVATGLRSIGVGPGDRVVVFMANCPEVGIAYAAIWRAGAVVTPVVFLISRPELRHILSDSGAAAVITSPELLDVVTDALDGRPVPVVVVGDDLGELERHEPSSIVDRDPDDLAALLYTGGTTGRSRGVCLTHANLSHAGQSSRALTHVPGVTRGISGLPLSHSFGLMVSVGGMHLPEPTTAVLLRWFDATAWLRLAAEHRSQTAAMVPSMLTMLLACRIEEYDLRELRYVYTGASPLPPAVRDEFTRRVPGCAVLEGYGCTETAGIATTNPPGAARHGTVGRPVPGVRIRVVDQSGADVALGGDGEVLISGPNVMARYWDATAPQGEWFHTGDVGRLDAEGYLTIVDRIKDLIIRGGYNIYPRDIEDVLTAHPDVTSAGVVGRADERLGEEVIAFVALAPGATVTVEELMTYAKANLAAHKYPREIRVVDAIPLTSILKVDRKRLRESVA